MIPPEIHDTIVRVLRRQRSGLVHLVRGVELAWIGAEWYAPRVAQAKEDIAQIEAIDAALAWLEQLPAPPQPDWSQAPSWSNWWAVDANGRAWWEQSEPTISLNLWSHTAAFQFADAIDIPTGIDWRTLKECRP
jgi:hypothetical protein